MASLQVIDHTGKKIKSLKVADELIKAEVSPALLAQAIRVYQSNQRQATKSTQNRAEVTFSTAKIWRQKGTGRARHGSRRAPIFVGGGRAHGPTGNENYKLKLTKKMRKRALAAAFTYLHEHNSLVIIDSLTKIDGKTKNAKTILTKVAQYPDKKILVILNKPEATILQATSNLPNVTITQAHRVHIYELLAHDLILTTPEAIKQVTKRVADQ